MAVRNADRGNMLAGLRVLLVDDDEDLLSLVEGLAARDTSSFVVSELYLQMTEA